MTVAIVSYCARPEASSSKTWTATCLRRFGCSDAAAAASLEGDAQSRDAA